MKTIITNIVALSLALGSLTARAESFQTTGAAPEPKKGSGQLVGGILLTSIGSTIGGLILLFGPALTDCENVSNETCDRRTSQTFLAGLAIGGTSLGVGIPLIVSGARQRKEWKSWKRQQVQEGEDRRATRSLNFGMKRLSGGPAAALTFNFN